MRVYHEALIRCAAALQVAILDHANADEIGDKADEKKFLGNIRSCIDQANAEYAALRKAVAGLR